MRDIYILFCAIFLACCTQTQIDDEIAVEEQALTRSDTVNEYDLNALSALFEEDVRMLDEAMPQSCFTYSVSTAPFNHSVVLSVNLDPHNTSDITKLLILVESSIYNEVLDKIKRYAIDISTAYGCAIFVESVSGGSHIDIKNLILSYQKNLNGAVLIGDIPFAYFEIADDHKKYGYRKWPCDLYYMDLNGTWDDTDGNDIFDTHTGDILPEIFVGRISTKNMGTLVTEIDGMNRYLDKNHDFWHGNTTINYKSGLSYVDKDWASLSHHMHDIQYLYGNHNYETKCYGDSNFGRTEYLSCLINDNYEFIQLSCHASPTYLAMSGGSIWSNEIYNNGADAIGYNLFCCSACNWTGSANNGFLAGAHIYNAKQKSLVVVGSTKTGSMLDFDYFYKPLGQGKPIGEALKAWWNITQYRDAHSRISWFYGMTIIGDPMINFLYKGIPHELTLNGYEATHSTLMSRGTLTVNNYVIPFGKHVTFKAPDVTLSSGFTCNKGGTFEIKNEFE